MKVVLIGIQGSGKSTQGNLLSKRLGVPYLSTGHVFREISKEKTKLGRYVKELINSGSLIPDTETIEIVNSYLTRSEYRNGYILDGFPRTIKQAEKFVNNVDKVIYLQVPDKEALWRLAYRSEEERDDNTIDAIKKRIELFHTHTKPVIDYYDRKRILSTIDGNKEIESVNHDILMALGKQIVKNKVKSWQHDKRTLMVLVGLPGSGKSEAAEYFKRKGLPVISFGKVINDYIDKNGLSHTNDVHKKVRTELREKYGFEAMAVLNKDEIEKAFDKGKIVVIDGMRSWEEYEYISKVFPDAMVKIVSIFTDTDIRYKRISGRGYRNDLKGKERDIKEVVDLNMGSTIALADFVVKNDYTVEDFYDKLEEVYRSVYYR